MDITEVFNLASCGNRVDWPLVAICIQLVSHDCLFCGSDLSFSVDDLEKKQRWALLSAWNWILSVYCICVHERYVTRLRRKLQFEERKQANQRRVLSDSETVRWLNHAVENIWPICMEQIASQNILLPIIPWFLEKYKPWTAKEAVVQHLYLGRNPPLFTEMRVLRQSNDDHLVLELGMNFLTADDMSAILAVKLRKRLGFGMWAKLHITGMHVEGKILVGVKFLRNWPFLGRLRVCFVEPPYFQMTVKPMFTHGLDVTELPGIAGWLFMSWLLEMPNMLVVDVEKFVSPEQEPWFSVDEKDPVAYAKVEVVEASDMKPSDLNGLADPYVKVRDKDHFYDDILGDCSVNINDLRDGQRHDMWLPLQNVKMGRLHLAITILEDNVKGVDTTCEQEKVDIEERKNSFANETTNKSSFSSVTSEKSQKLADDYEPINVEGQKETGIWVHHPGSEVSQTWEPRKGKSRRLDTEIQRQPNDLVGNCNSPVSESLNNDSSSPDNNPEDKHRMKSVRKGLHKIGGIGVHFVMEDNIGGFPSGKVQVEGGSTEENSPDSPAKGHVKDVAKNILKHAEKSARSLKHVLSGKSRKYKGDSLVVPGRENESDSSYDESLSVPSPIDERTEVVSQTMASCSNGSPKPRVIVVQSVPPNTTLDKEAPMKNNCEEEPKKACSHDRSSEGFVKSVEPEHVKEEVVVDKRDISSFSN
ncbi:Synaptotagmin-like mitochondrial-lipid-binding domain [Sesbania bispinosa]|nr:Synaptotagmin-like mitochondrial-lipid-binding domain [Sesbania bispinosa]